MEEAACYALGVRVASSYSYAREGGSAFFFIFSPLSPPLRMMGSTARPARRAEYPRFDKQEGYHEPQNHASRDPEPL
nr:MAG TPA: hypothetical protein [Bacteriophage sp.]